MTKMLKSTLLRILVFCSTSVVSQNIVGNYQYKYLRKKDQKNVVIEINILNDSTYHINGYEGNKPDDESYKKTNVLGKIRKVKNNWYVLSEYNANTKQFIERQVPVKITPRKIVFYAYKQIKSRKISKKTIKAFALKRASI